VFAIEWIHIDWWQIWMHLCYLMIAYVLALPIGLDRQVSSRHFGLRTLRLVGRIKDKMDLDEDTQDA
jgi:putative Mg2+ transporter-C (MgtC) family protein